MPWLILSVPPSAYANPPAERIAVLRRGVNLTGWFLHPGSRDPAALRAWMSDAAMDDLHRAGFTFVRLAIDPALADTLPARALLRDQIARLERHGLAVVVSIHAIGWNPDTDPADRDRLVALWRDLAGTLHGLSAGLTFPETLNEPVFHDDPAAWWALRRRILLAIRAVLPDVTVVLTGHDWSSIAGLQASPRESDGDVVETFHFYDPPELTSLAAWRPGLDRAALARLPFPVEDRAACERIAATAGDAPTGDVMRFYCAYGWDAARVRAALSAAARVAEARHVPLMLGEFGASVALNEPARLAWLRLVRETCETLGIGWALWGYDDSMGLNVSRPPSGRPVLNRSLLQALGLVAR